MNQEQPSKTRKKILELYEQQELANLQQSCTRARSCSVGTSTGGMVEISMRGDFANLWYLLHPVEAIEMIESLASVCGVEIAMRPKENFSSWRSWNLDQPDNSYWLGAAPFQMSQEEKLQAKKARESLPVSIEEIKKEIKKLPKTPEADGSKE